MLFSQLLGIRIGIILSVDNWIERPATQLGHIQTGVVIVMDDLVFLHMLHTQCS
jgi:hypothetical protein